MKYQARMNAALAGKSVLVRKQVLAVAAEADDELAGLQRTLAGQRDVFTRWIRDALVTLDSVDPDDLPDAEHLQRLIASGERLLKP